MNKLTYEGHTEANFCRMFGGSFTVWKYRRRKEMDEEERREREARRVVRLSTWSGFCRASPALQAALRPYARRPLFLTHAAKLTPGLRAEYQELLRSCLCPYPFEQAEIWRRFQRLSPIKRRPSA